MSAFYDRMAQTALRLIAQFGQELTLRDETAGEFDPVTGMSGPPTVFDQFAQAILQDYGLQQSGASYAAGTEIQQGDKKIMVAAQTYKVGYSVRPGDLLHVDSDDGPEMMYVTSLSPKALKPPKMTTRIFVAGVMWTIVNIKEINPAGTPLVYEIQGRR